jgi:hypothetical protein
MSTDAKETELEYREDKEGGVVITMPADEVEDDDEPVSAAAGGSQEADDDADDESADGDYDSPIREARRARRKAKKEYIKKTNVEKDQRLQMLDRENAAMKERLAVLERKAQGTDLAQIDRAIDDEERRLQWAQKKREEAISNSDGALSVQAEDAVYEARQKVEQLRHLKQRAMQAAQEAPAHDPRIKRHSDNWLAENDWYDSGLKDEDSKIAKVVDSTLHEEGWDPAMPDYWQEFNRRLHKKLPHRYTDSDDERSSRRPRSVVTGSGRETMSEGGRVNVVIEPEKIRAMKDAGLWENEVLRKKMLQRYARESRKYPRS